MRLIWMCCLTLSFNGMLQAQETTKITYKETATFQLPLLEGLDSSMIANLPTSSSTVKELYFTAEHSIYRDAPKKEEDVLATDRPGVLIRMDSPNSKCYVHYTDKKVVKQEEFMSRIFLIESKLEAPQWKLTGKQEKILDLVCQEAVIQDSTQTIRVWFAPQLKQAVGPDQFVGFPGAVLRVNVDEGQLVLEATAIEQLAAVEKTIIQRPKEGKKVTQEEFARIQQEKMREMQEQYGGEDNVIIRVERR